MSILNVLTLFLHNKRTATQVCTARFIWVCTREILIFFKGEYLLNTQPQRSLCLCARQTIQNEI